MPPETPGHGSTVDQPTIPEEYAPAAPPPVRARPVHWLLAPFAAVAAWFVPRRLGPHLLASGWRAAYLVHVGSLLITVCFVIAVVLVEEEGVPLSFRTVFRAPPAMLVVLWMQATGDITTMIGFTLGVFCGHAGLWLAASMVAPWIASGESNRIAYFRAVRLLLWLTSAILPIAPAMTLTGLIWQNEYRVGFQLVMTVMLFGMWWMISVGLRMGQRYAGPAIGPGFEPREPRCESCGYQLTLQPLDARCPECGLPVRESLPERRRTPGGEAGWRSWLEFFPRTWRASLFARRFARRLAVHRGYREARRFAICVTIATTLVGGLIVTPLVALQVPLDKWVFSFGQSDFWESPVAEFICNMPFALLYAGLLMLGMTAQMAWLATVCGWVQPARRGLVVCYASGYLIVPAVLGGVSAWGMWFVADVWEPQGFWVMPIIGGGVTLESMLIAICVIPPAAALLLWLFHVRRMLHATRYANA